MTNVLFYLILFFSFLNSGYMAFDGLRAFILGDYLRPKKGDYAGKLGPWTIIVKKLSIDPMSALMKSVFVIFGLSGLTITIAFAMKTEWSWNAMLIFNICAAWNLMFGTMTSVIQVVLLLVLKYYS